MSELLDNRYRILQTLGKGGFGETFLAEDTKTPSKRRCVIKRLKPQTDDAETWNLIKERFEREAAILETLGQESAQIPSLYAYFTENHDFYLVQDWIEGENLCEIVNAKGVFDEKSALEFLVGTLPVLEFVHSQGIIHRDIKPENIMRRAKDGKYILIDFGAVKEVATTVLDAHGTPTSSIIIGTQDFMPLEQAAGKPVFASDLYALALTAVYLLTTKRPRAMQDLTTGDIDWRKFAPEVSADLAAVLNKAIEERARDRFPTASEMLAALQTVELNAVESPKAINKLLPIPTSPNDNLPQTEFSEPETIVAESAGKKISVELESSNSNNIAAIQPLVSHPSNEKSSRFAGLFLGGLLVAGLIGFVFTMMNGGVVIPSPNTGNSANVSSTNVTNTTSNTNTARISTNTATNANTTVTHDSRPQTFKNSFGMEFVKIPAGSFMMGAEESEKDSSDEERPQHKVTISRDFYMGKTEVTREQWKAVTGENYSWFKECWKCPIEQVTWDETQEFIKKLNARNDGVYRLPTEAEWEYAARAGTTGDYPGNLSAIAWYNRNSNDKSHPVGMKQANAFGLYDMHGSIREWCSDWYGKYESGEAMDPTGALSGTRRVMRGGSRLSPEVSVRSAARENYEPSFRNDFVGFRVIRE